MPVIKSDFRSPWWMLGGDLQTQLPVVLRFICLESTRVTINTQDNDQLNADFYSAKTPTKSLLIITHGLEGNSRQAFVTGFAKKIVNEGIAGKPTDVLAWNLRGCGTIDNPSPKLYFGGSTADFDDVVSWAEVRGYTDIYLASYSLGGNIVLRWLGNQGANAVTRGIKSACNASAPVDLKACTKQLDRWRNIIYRIYFIFSMKYRLYKKAKNYPGAIDLSKFNQVNSFSAYDETYSAPLNNFSTVDTLYVTASAKLVLNNIAVPCLLVDAENDPFLSDTCIPVEIASQHLLLTLEITKTGGHVGFLSNKCHWWLDERFLAFFNQ